MFRICTIVPSTKNIGGFHFHRSNKSNKQIIQMGIHDKNVGGFHKLLTERKKGGKRSRVKMLDLGCGKRGVQRWEQDGRSARKWRGKLDPFSGWRASSWPYPNSPGDGPARLRNLGPCPCRKLLCPCRGWACHRPRTREFCRLRDQIGRKGEFAGRSSSNVEEGSWFEFVVGVSNY